MEFVVSVPHANRVRLTSAARLAETDKRSYGRLKGKSRDGSGTWELNGKAALEIAQ